MDPSPEDPSSAEAASAEAASAAGRSSQRAVGRGTLLLLASSGFGAAANFLVALVVARLMSQSDAGVFFVATAIFVLVYSLTRLAAGVGLVKFLAEHRALQEPERVAGTLSAGLVPVLGLSVLTGAALMLLGHGLASTVMQIDDPSRTAIIVWAGLIPFAAASDVLISATRGFDAFGPAAVIERIVRPGAQLVLVAVTAALGAGPQWAAVAWAAPYVLSSVWTWLWLGRLRGSQGLAWDPAAFGPFWRFTGPRTLGVAIQSVLQRLDVLLLSAMRSPAEAAVYVAASRYLVVGQVIGNSFSLSIQPRISRHAVLGQTEALKGLFRTSTAWLVLTSWPLFLSMIVFGPVLMSVFGSGYESGVPALVVLAIAMLFGTGVGPVDQVLIMTGRPMAVTVISVISLVVNIAVNLALIPVLGALGAAIAWAASILIRNLLALWQVRRSVGVDPFSRAWAVAAGLATFSWLILPLLVRTVMGNDVAALGVAGALATITYVLALRRWHEVLAIGDSPVSFVLTGRRQGRRRRAK